MCTPLFSSCLKINHTNLVLGSDVSLPTIFDTRILNTNGALFCLSQELNLHCKKKHMTVQRATHVNNFKMVYNKICQGSLDNDRRTRKMNV
jgi:hypothetical protein